MIEENKITNNINQDSSDCDAVNLILNANDKSAELIPDDLDESSSSDEKSSLSDESLQEITMEKVMQVERYRKPRDSSYKELVQDYQRRSSRASVKKNYCVGNPFHNFYSGMNQKDLEKSQKSEYEDNEAEFLEGEGEYKANFSKQ